MIELIYKAPPGGLAVAARDELIGQLVALSEVEIQPYPEGGEVVLTDRSPVGTRDLVYAAAAASVAAIQAVSVLPDPAGGVVVERVVTPNPQQKFIAVLVEARIKLAELGT